MTTTAPTETTDTEASPAWLKVGFPERFHSISIDRVHELLDPIDGATPERVTDALGAVLGNRYWVYRDDFDKIQEKLFATLSAPVRIGVGASVLRRQLIAEGFTQDDVAGHIRWALESSGQTASADPVITAAEESVIRIRLRAATNIPDDAGAAATARILAQRSTIRRLENVEHELAAFKERVADVASEYAVRHGWCSVVDQALGELGLERRAEKYTATAMIKVTFTATLAQRRGLPSEEWVRNSIREDALLDAIREDFALDDDHSGVEIDDVEIDEITDVEHYEE